jgi:orotate phosphoribosyltransferase-like protein
MERLFQSVNFISHSGIPLTWKIECDAIHDDEWATLAKMIREYEPRNWSRAVGIPRGGSKLGEELDKYSTGNEADPLLIVDDVYTTGRSFKNYIEQNTRPEQKIICWCVFARKPTESEVQALFTMPKNSA